MRDEAMTPVVGATRAPEGIWQRFRASLRTVVREAGAAFERTPLEVLLGASAAIGFSTMVQWRTEDRWTPLLVTVGLALPLVYAASALYTRGVLSAPLRWGLSAAAVVGAALYGFLVFDQDLEGEGWRAFLLVAASVSALLCVPLVGHRPGRPADAGYRREATQRFAARLVIRLVFVMAYAAALFVGLALALQAVNGLFELNMGGKPFEHLVSALFLLLPPWALAAGLPALVAPIEPWSDEEHKWFRRVGALLVAPLVLVYLGIVYAYTIRVLTLGEVPKNLVSPVVIGAGLLIVLATVALEPVHDDEKAGGLALLIRLASPLLFPLVLFAIWAVNARVDQYGWTEFRYLRLLALVLLALWGAASAVQLIRRRRPPLLPLPAGLALALLLSAVGPWSALAVARRDQSEGLRTLLAAAGKTGPGASTAVPSKTFNAIDDKARYLNTHFGWATLQSVAPWVGRHPAGRVWSGQVAPLLGITDNGVGTTRVARATLPDDVGVPGIAGGTLYPFFTGTPPSPPGTRARAGAPVPVAPRPSPSGLSVRLEATPGRLLVLAGGDTLVAELAPLVGRLMARADSAAASAPLDARAAAPRKAPDGVIELDLAPGDAVLPLAHGNGRGAGQLVLRTLEVESAPPPAAAGPAKGAPPQTPAASPATSSPAAAQGGRILRLRSAAGFVILTS